MDRGRISAFLRGEFGFQSSMIYLRRPIVLASITLLLLAHRVTTPAAPAAKGPTVKDLNTPRTFPEVKTLPDWQARAQEIREQILVSCGLWPLPAKKRPVSAHVFRKIERDGYSIEQVYLETYPGFYLAGNLYRPLGRGKGRFPGILNPHGHWANGRMADTKDGSIAARCISFARQGMVAFSYDMVGYNDTRFPEADTNRALYETHRTFGTNRTDQLWSISLMGLQTWNSIRALDFLASLPDVDTKRLACTGESGGGTQTFMLGAVDDRLAAQAPVVMVSHTMQGGCSCENAPSLRVEYSNMEIAAVPAPRPQILVSATGDWTKATMEVEGPAIGKIYQLFGAADRLRYVRFDYGHNYNQTSREAVYAWFGYWLLHHRDPASLKEQPYQKEPDALLRVFPGAKLPEDALPKEQFIESLKQAHRQQWQQLLPQNQAALEEFKQLMLPAWKHTLQVEWPEGRIETKIKGLGQPSDWMASEMILERPGEEQALTVTCFRPRTTSRRATKLVVLADAAGAGRYIAENGAPTGVAEKLLAGGQVVMVIRNFSTGEPPDQFANFFTTYNRTKLQARVRDLLAAVAVGKSLEFGKSGEPRVVLYGAGVAGLWALLAAPGADAVVADCNAADVSKDEALLNANLFCPGIRNIGTFEGAAMLAAPKALLLHNVGMNFPTGGIRSAYKASSAGRKLRVEKNTLNDETWLDWVSKL
jgi:dienelactone hydrolase